MKQIATRVLLAEDQTLKDFDGDYEYYLSQNQAEAVKMEVKEERSKEIIKDNIKAKSKVRTRTSHRTCNHLCAVHVAGQVYVHRL